MKHHRFIRWQAGLGLLSLLVFMGCGSGGTPEQGSGIAATQERTLEYFDTIKVSGLGKVIVRFGVEDRCEVRADDNLIDAYETRVKNGTLFLAPTKLMAPRMGLTTTINTSRTITHLEISGACEVVFQKVAAHDLTVTAKDAVQFTASGSVDELSINATGTMEAELFELASGNVSIVADGSSRINVAANNSLDVKADGAVIVTYAGDAKVTQALTGVSRVNSR